MPVEALNKARLEATVRPEGKMKSQKKWPAPSVMASGLLLALSFLGYIYYPLQSLAVAAVIFGVPAILVRSVASIKSLTLNINVLVLMAGNPPEFRQFKLKKGYYFFHILFGNVQLWELLLLEIMWKLVLLSFYSLFLSGLSR